MSASWSMRFQSAGLRLAASRWEAEGVARGTVVLLHGGGQTRHSWHRSGPRFAKHGWHVVTLDARGHGESDWAPDADYSIDAMVGDLVNVLGAITGPVVLVGASMGGMTALVGEAEHGPLCQALVLVDIAPRAEKAGLERIYSFLTAHLEGFDSLEQVCEAIAAYNPQRPASKNLEGVKKNVRQREDGRWYWHWDPKFIDVTKSDSHQRYLSRMYEATKRVKCPVLLVRGSRSDVVSEEGAAELQQLIPQAQRVDVTAGHMVAGDDNDVFAEKVVAFLDTTVPFSAR